MMQPKLWHSSTNTMVLKDQAGTAHEEEQEEVDVDEARLHHQRSHQCQDMECAAMLAGEIGEIKVSKEGICLQPPHLVALPYTITITMEMVFSIPT